MNAAQRMVVYLLIVVAIAAFWYGVVVGIIELAEFAA